MKTKNTKQNKTDSEAQLPYTHVRTLDIQQTENNDEKKNRIKS